MVKDMAARLDIESKEKYQSREKAHERTELEWRRAEQLLRSMASKLSLLSTIDDLPFVNRLEALRTSIQDGLPTLTLEPLFGEITAYIQKLETSGSLPAVLPVAEHDLKRQSFSAMLLGMISRVQFPAAFQDSLEPAKALLRLDVAENTNDHFVRGLEAYFEVLADFYLSVSNEKARMNEYLHLLTNQLLELNDDIRVTEHIQHASVQAGEEIDTMVNSEVNEMEGSISMEVDINNLKACIQERLQIIRGCIARHKAKEDARHRQAEELIDKLNKRIQQMEKETDQLKLMIAEKQRQNLSDALTGIANRQAYDERIKQECERFYRNKTPVTLMVCDVDNFKSINDNHGHAAGDKVLMAISKVLQKSIRSIDFLARFGGEEFVIIMPGTGLADGTSAAEKLRKKIESFNFRVKDQIISVTISGGVAQLRDSDSPASLFDRADNALYVAKESGRNRIEIE